MITINDQFEAAKQKVSMLHNDPGDSTKLKLYALFKQATIGKCNTPKPKMFDLVGKAKWEAWNALGDMLKDEAKRKYVELVNELMKPNSGSIVPNKTSSGKYQFLIVKKENKITKIILNRPNKKNAISFQMYEEIMHSLHEAIHDDTIITVITGAGDYFSSGNDFGNFSQASEVSGEMLIKRGEKLINDFVSSFIDFPKPLVALVNGPAVGISVTILALFDIVYASDKATFHTPFSALGMSPEGCSSYLFPKLMGPSKANEMLMFNKKITAKEAVNLGLVTEVFPDNLFIAETNKKLQDMAKNPLKSLQYAKMINRNLEKDILHKVNDEECKNLTERWVSDDFFTALANLKSRKSHL